MKVQFELAVASTAVLHYQQRYGVELALWILAQFRRVLQAVFMEWSAAHVCHLVEVLALPGVRTLQAT